MRRLLLLALLTPMLSFCQMKNVVSTFRVFPKVGMAMEFEKAFKAHAAKYHTGDWKWRVFEIQSGPDAGGFMVAEGPLTWDQFDKRGDLGAAHTADWAKMVMPYTADRGTQDYSEYDADMSTVKLTDYTDKIMINHIYPKPGMVIKLQDLTKKFKAVWTAGNESVAVYKTVGSGEPQLITVLRMKDGLKELASDYRKPMPERYNAVNGPNSWDDYVKDFSSSVDRRWSELLFLRKDMSSK